mmetsp:Transcript_58881/g.137575  ORF Transcript_58881/g.137575 Transcript_58881/m.137575 type:complete len:252 (+) Transcript_58881:51-806(+)
MQPVRASHQIVCTIPTALPTDVQAPSREGAQAQPHTPHRRGRPEPLQCEVNAGSTWAAGPMATPKTGDRPDMTSSLELGTASFRGSAIAMSTPAGGAQVARPSTAHSCGTPTAGGGARSTLSELDNGRAPSNVTGARAAVRRSGSFGQIRGAPVIAPLGTEVCQPTSTSFQPSGLSTPKTADRPDLNSSLLMGSATFRGSATPKGAAGFTDHFPTARASPAMPATPTRRISISSVRTVPIRRASGVSLRAS